MGSANWGPVAGEDETCMFAMQLTHASTMAMVLSSAIELDILELIKKAGPGAHVSPSELAALLQTQNPDAAAMLDRMLYLLATHSILTCSLKTLPDGGFERLYGLAPVCKFLTKDDDRVSLAPLLLLNQDKALTRTWYHLKDAIREGGVPFTKAYGMHIFEYQRTDQRFASVFNQAMSGNSRTILKKTVEIYKGFEGLKTIVDVGGGIGTTLNMIVSKYPTIKGINFDLPDVIKVAPSYPGIEHVGGDMFVSIPEGDAILLKCVLHDWTDELCLKILKNCYKALPENGKVILIESVLPEAPNTMLSTQNVIHLDLLMLANTPGGKERTEKEFAALAKGAAFKEFRKINCAYSYAWVMEFLK